MKTLFIGNLGGGEWIIIMLLLVFILFIPFLLGYYMGLAKGRKEKIIH